MCKKKLSVETPAIKNGMPFAIFAENGIICQQLIVAGDCSI